jgi:signal transduction histidine kinase
MNPIGALAQYVLVVRMVAAAVPIAVLPHERRVAGAVVVAVALALLLNFAGLRRWEWVLSRLETPARRAYLLLDVALGLVLLAQLGTGSPFVLYTVGTAALAGLLFRRAAVLATTVALLSGYLVVAVLGAGITRGGDDFHAWVTLPASYLLAGGGGAVLRRVLVAHQRASAEVGRLAQQTAVGQERLRLARDLHDSLTKSLHGLSLMAQALTRAADDGDLRAVRTTSALVARVLDEVSVEARRTVAGLRDEDVEDVRLGEALERRGSRDLGGAELQVHVGDYPEPPLPVRLELLAIVDEALENVTRHAGATSVRLALDGDGQGGVVLSVADDGCGYRPEAAQTRTAAGHFGLVGMRERAERAGGRLEVTTAPGAGTRVVVHRRPVAVQAMR